MDVDRFAKLAHELQIAHEEEDAELVLKLRSLCLAALNDAGNEIGVVAMEDVEPQQIDAVWPPYVVRGKITLIEADPGVGKSLAVLQFAAQISNGGTMFSGVGPGHATVQLPQGDILFLAAEDDLEDTVRPRLDALGADLSRILFAVEDHARVDLSNIGALDRLLENHKPIMLVADPVSAYCGDVDTHRQNAVTDFLLPLRTLARRHNCAVLLVRHLTKEQKRSALHDGMGSIGFVSVARSVLRLGVDPDHEDVGGMFHVKCSYARLGRPLGFEKREVGCAGALCWTGPTTLTLDIVRSGRQMPGIAEQRALKLDAHLRAHGPQLTRVLQELLKWTKDALQKARTDIGSDVWKIPKKLVREEDRDPGAQGSPWLVGRPGQCEENAVKEYVSNGKLNYIATINRGR